MKKVLIFITLLAGFGLASYALANTLPFVIYDLAVTDYNESTTPDGMDVAPNGSVYAVYQESSSGSNFKVKFTKKMSGQSTFTTGVALHGGTGDELYPSIDVDSRGWLASTWVKGASGARTVYARYSTDGGQNFSNIIPISTSGSNSFPRVAIGKDTNLYVIWRNMNSPPFVGALKLARSTNGGQTWQPIQYINHSGESSLGYENNLGMLHIAVKPGTGTNPDTVAIVWEGIKVAGDDETYAWIAVSYDSGQTFTTASKIDDSGASDQNGPDIAIDDNYFYTAWRDATPGSNALKFRRLRQGTTNFETITTIVDPEGGLPSSSPTIDSTRNGHIYMTWQLERPYETGYAFFTRSTNAGETFEPITRVSTNLDTRAMHPSVAMSKNNKMAHVVWYRLFNGIVTDDIYYANAVVPLIALNTPQTTTVARGGQITFNFAVYEQEGVAKNFDWWASAYTPSGGVIDPLTGPGTASIGANGYVNANKTYNIPTSATLGTYRMCLNIGDHPNMEDSDCAYFEVTP